MVDYLVSLLILNNPYFIAVFTVHPAMLQNMFNQTKQFTASTQSNLTLNSLLRSIRFLIKGVLKIWSKFTGEHPCRSAISIKFKDLVQLFILSMFLSICAVICFLFPKCYCEFLTCFKYVSFFWSLPQSLSECFIKLHQCR